MEARIREETKERRKIVSSAADFRERLAAHVTSLENLGVAKVRKFSFIVEPDAGPWHRIGNRTFYRIFGLHHYSKRTHPKSTTRGWKEALDSAKSRVFGLDGYYQFDEGLVYNPPDSPPNHYLTIEGESRGCVLALPSNVHEPILTFGSNARQFVHGGVHRVDISMLSLYGNNLNSSANSSQHGIVLSTSGTIRHCYARGLAGDSFRLYPPATTYVSVIDCNAASCFNGFHSIGEGPFWFTNDNAASFHGDGFLLEGGNNHVSACSSGGASTENNGGAAYHVLNSGQNMFSNFDADTSPVGLLIEVNSPAQAFAGGVFSTSYMFGNGTDVHLRLLTRVGSSNITNNVFEGIHSSSRNNFVIIEDRSNQSAIKRNLFCNSSIESSEVTLYTLIGNDTQRNYFRNVLGLNYAGYLANSKIKASPAIYSALPRLPPGTGLSHAVANPFPFDVEVYFTGGGASLHKVDADGSDVRIEGAHVRLSPGEKYYFDASLPSAHLWYGL